MVTFRHGGLLPFFPFEASKQTNIQRNKNPQQKQNNNNNNEPSTPCARYPKISLTLYVQFTRYGSRNVGNSLIQYILFPRRLVAMK